MNRRAKSRPKRDEPPSKVTLVVDANAAMFLYQGLREGKSQDQYPERNPRDTEEDYQEELDAYDARHKVWDKLVYRLKRACVKLGFDPAAPIPEDENEMPDAGV